MTHSLFQPTYLKKGAHVGIVATARKISLEELAPAIQLLEDWGLKVVIGESIGAEEHQFAGSDELRAKDFQQMINRQDIAAIICARGGYGTIRIMEYLDFSGFMRHPKWIVGFSDITVLHHTLNQLIGVQSIHGPMMSTICKGTASAADSLRKALFGEKLEYPIEPHPLNIVAKASGNLMGGNLSLLYSLTGTNTVMATAGKVLFLEDLDEYLYHVDRMMMNMKLANKLKGISALVVGGMTDMKDNAIPFGKNAEEIIYEHAKGLNIPLLFNFPAGHIDNNLALYLGRNAQISFDEQLPAFSYSA
jgi:muramoyltetrapeptide carboxypeptidase